MFKLTFALGPILLISGCGSTGPSVIKLTPGGKAIHVIDSAEEANNCRSVGEAKAYPPYVLPYDAKHTLRNKAAELGGDTMLITNHAIGVARSQVYDCQK